MSDGEVWFRRRARDIEAGGVIPLPSLRELARRVNGRREYMCAGGNRIVRQHLFLLAHDDDLRMQILLVLDNHRAHEAGCFIDIALDRNARNHVAEFNFAALIGQNRHVVRIPLHEGFALFDRRLVLFRND